MTKFKQYYSALTEKVTKQQFERAVQDPNIIVGGEFEFISSNLRDALGGGEDNLRNERERLESLYSDAYQEYEEYEDRRLFLMDAYESVAKKANNVVKKRYPKMDAPYFNYFKKWKAGAEPKYHQSKLFPDHDNAIIYEEPPTPESIVTVEPLTDKQIEDRKSDYELAKWNWETHYSEINSLKQRIDFILNQKYPGYVRTNYEIPQIGYNYIQYMDEVSGRTLGSRDKFNNFSPVLLKHLVDRNDIRGIDKLGFPILHRPRNEEVDYYLENIADNLDSSMGDSTEAQRFFNKSPIKKHWARAETSETQSVGDTTWFVKEDGSLRPQDEGVEITSPPMPIPEFMEICPKMFDWIEDIGETNSSCGFHVHMSMKDYDDLADKLNVLKLVLLTDEEYIYKFFDERKGSIYARSMKDSNPVNYNVKSLIDKTALREKMIQNSERFFGINLHNLREGHVEFRYLGGEGYSQKWPEIKRMIGFFAHNFAAAVDENYMKREYQERLNNLDKKIQMVILDAQRQELVFLIDQFHDDPNAEYYLRRRKKELEELEKRLGKRIPESDPIYKRVMHTIGWDTYGAGYKKSMLEKMRELKIIKPTMEG